MTVSREADPSSVGGTPRRAIKRVDLRPICRGSTDFRSHRPGCRTSPPAGGSLHTFLLQIKDAFRRRSSSGSTRIALTISACSNGRSGKWVFRWPRAHDSWLQHWPRHAAPRPQRNRCRIAEQMDYFAARIQIGLFRRLQKRPNHQRGRPTDQEGIGNVEIWPDPAVVELEQNPSRGRRETVSPRRVDQTHPRSAPRNPFDRRDRPGPPPNTQPRAVVSQKLSAARK